MISRGKNRYLRELTAKAAVVERDKLMDILTTHIFETVNSMSPTKRQEMIGLVDELGFVLRKDHPFPLR